MQINHLVLLLLLLLLLQDFGEYSPDEYYTAQTSEGEQISQLIAGYIDIILKKQKATDHPGLQGDEESAMYEENVQAERLV